MALMARNGIVNLGVASATSRSAFFKTASSSSSSTSFQGQLADAYFASDSRPIVLFDGVCNMCNGGVNFVLDNDPVGRIRFAALQSEAGRALLLRSGRAPDDISSLVLVEKDRSYIKSEGVLRTAQYLQSLFPPIASIALLFPLFFRDFVYESIADNRYSVFGQTNVCRMSDAQFKERFIE
ncbi:unnamed protein product [Sphagnum jensenii]|uniref:Thiol-disulfide oxidoreductase DCC n=1 Tax=Sphagnum jensenii TaxID=128206 RepID=A0ABP1B239_9BRYO